MRTGMDNEWVLNFTKVINNAGLGDPPTTARPLTSLNALEVWTINFVHNTIVHPLLPWADLLYSMGLDRAAERVYSLHESTSPNGGQSY